MPMDSSENTPGPPDRGMELGKGPMEELRSFAPGGPETARKQDATPTADLDQGGYPAINTQGSER